MKPAIAIPAFSRVATLERLLASLIIANVPAGTPLFIAVDRAAEARHKAGNDAVNAFVRGFRWPHGPQEIIIHAEHIGLVENVFFCGAQAERFGAVILLEDDLIVSKQSIDYAQQALDFYGNEPRVAGISLNSLWFNGFTHQPFTPMLDDGDIYFLQLSTPQGQAYTAAQWAEFNAWRATNDRRVTAADGVHELFASFPDDDWLHVKAKYLAATGKYYVYPRESLTTNFGESGTHFGRPTALFQVPLQHFRREFRFQAFDACHAVYDGFYELLPERLGRLVCSLTGLSFDIDLYASKAPHQLQAGFTLTTRRCRKAIREFGKKMWPLETNVIDNVPGAGITLARREDVDTGRGATRAARRDNDRYFARRK
jgi:hypothetical protein